MEARLARMHLRGGLLPLARTGLERMAAAGTLDIPALADLAEARWRGGDLIGASEPAQAHMAAGGSEPIAMLICVEALDAGGNLDAARSLAVQVLERVGGQVDRLFAGEPRGAAWPSAGSPSPLVQGTVPFGALVGGAEVYDPDPELWRTSVVADAGDTVATLADAHAWDLNEAIALGELTAIAERLALQLRLDPDSAVVILSQADRILEAAGQEVHASAALQIVRGDALHVLGKSRDAEAAYGRSVRAIATQLDTEDTS